jgi:hypothetical protein
MCLEQQVGSDSCPHRAKGRSVGASRRAVAKDGSLFVADDTGGTIWRISYTGKRDGAVFHPDGTKYDSK